AILASILIRRFALSTSTPPPSLPPGCAAGTNRTKKANVMNSLAMSPSFNLQLSISLADAHHRGPLLSVQPFEVAGGDINFAVVDHRAAVDHAGAHHILVRAQIERPALLAVLEIDGMNHAVQIAGIDGSLGDGRRCEERALAGIDPAALTAGQIE